MITLTVNAAALTPVIIVLIACTVAGAALGFLNVLVDDGFSLFVGIAEAIAGGSSSYKEPARRKAGVAVRAVIYVILWLGAIALSLQGFQALAYFFAVVGGIALPIAIIKLLR